MTGRRAWPGRLAVLAPAAVLVVVAISGCSHAARSSGGSQAPGSSSMSPASPTSASGPSAGADGSSAGSPTSGGQSIVPSGLASTVPARPLTSTGSFGGGVGVRVVGWTHGTEIDKGPDIIAGVPVVTFTIAFTNGTRAPVSVNNVQVDVTYGASRAPADQSNFAETSQLSGMLAAGATRTGTYAFSIPVAAQGDVEVTAWYASDRPTIALTGSVAAH